MNHKMIRCFVPSKKIVVTMKKRIVECFITYRNVVMRINDTDALVIAMGCKQFYDTSLKLWLEVGTPSKNAIRYTSIDQACEKFGSSLCNVLPAFHAFTGCDYTASFKKKRESFTF